MKVIDLLNDVANDKAPKKIRFKGGLYEFDKIQKDYVDIDQEYLFCNQFMIGKILNDEVEIIEEDKKIKPLKYIRIDDEVIWYGSNAATCDFDTKLLALVINELIIEIEKLKKGK